MISWAPPSNPDRLPASSKSAITDDPVDEYWVISSMYMVKFDEPSPIVPLSINMTRLYHSTDELAPEKSYVKTSHWFATVDVAVTSAVAVVFGQPTASSNFIIKFSPTLGDQTLTLSLASESNLNLSVTVNLWPPQVWPEFLTSFNTLSDELPLVSGLSMISWAPPSNPDRLPASSKLEIKVPAVTVELPGTNFSISSKWNSKPLAPNVPPGPSLGFPASMKNTSRENDPEPSHEAPGLGHACAVTVEKSNVTVFHPFLLNDSDNSIYSESGFPSSFIINLCSLSSGEYILTEYLLLDPETISMGLSKVISAVSHHSPLVVTFPVLFEELSGSVESSNWKPPFASNFSSLSKLIGNPIGFDFQK